MTVNCNFLMYMDYMVMPALFSFVLAEGSHLLSKHCYLAFFGSCHEVV